MRQTGKRNLKLFTMVSKGLRVWQTLLLLPGNSQNNIKVAVKSSRTEQRISDRHCYYSKLFNFRVTYMHVCDTSFERAKTAVLRGGDVRDFIQFRWRKSGFSLSLYRQKSVPR